MNFFERYNAPDTVAHAEQIVRQQRQLEAAEPGSLAWLDASSDLASLLTTARREGEALALLMPLQDFARAHQGAEPAGWFYLALGTAAQYVGEREKANNAFAEALRLSQSQHWQRLMHFVHVHWGRSRVEEGELGLARQHFEQALTQREAQGHPGAERVRALLQALQRL